MTLTPTTAAVVAGAAQARLPTPLTDTFDRFYRLLSPPGTPGNPVVFTHALRTPSGAERLVVVQAYENVDHFDDPTMTRFNVEFAARVFRPGGLSGPPVEVLHTAGEQRVTGASLGQVAVGRCDPADPSRFDIGVVVAGRPVTVTGWLLDDETVSFDARPLTPASRPGTPLQPAAP